MVIVVPATAEAMAVTEYFSYCQETKFSTASQSNREASGYNRFLNSAKHSGGAKTLQNRHAMNNTQVWAKEIAEDCICE